MPSERPLIVSEGNWLDDADRMLMSKQVDFRPRRTGQIRPLVDTAKPAISGDPRRELSSTS